MEIELIEHVMIKLQKKIKSIELDKDLIAEEDRVNWTCNNQIAEGDRVNWTCNNQIAEEDRVNWACITPKKKTLFLYLKMLM